MYLNNFLNLTFFPRLYMSLTNNLDLICASLYTALGLRVLRTSQTPNHYIYICPVKQIEGKSVQLSLHHIFRSCPSIVYRGPWLPSATSLPLEIFTNENED